jgi:hypothetical protein
MRAHGSVATAEAGSLSRVLDALAVRWRQWWLLRVAALTLACVVLAGLGWREAPVVGHILRGDAEGTVLLGTTTCADWRRYTVGRRLDTVAALGVAATAPDPESRGATMESGEAYGVLQTICSGRAASSTLLYEAYNRAASFRSGATAPVVGEGGFGTAAHR